MGTFVHIRNISAITDSICRFLERFLTAVNCSGDICPFNICYGHTCTYQEYLSCYWPDVIQTLEVGSWPSLADANRFGDICPVNICPQLLLTQFWPDFKGRLKKEIFWTNTFLDLTYLTQNCFDATLLDLKFFDIDYFWINNLLNQIFFTKITKIITTTTTTTLMGFDTIEINLVCFQLLLTSSVPNFWSELLFKPFIQTFFQTFC